MNCVEYKKQKYTVISNVVSKLEYDVRMDLNA